VQNAFATGNVFGDSVTLALNANTSIGVLMGRAQQPNTHQFSNLFYLDTAITDGQAEGLSLPRVVTTEDG